MYINECEAFINNDKKTKSNMLSWIVDEKKKNHKKSNVQENNS